MSELSTLPPELVAARLMARARQATARLHRLAWQDPECLAAAVDAVRSAIAELWPQVSPEAARDVMLEAASTACLNGVTTQVAVAGISSGDLAAVRRMLELADKWFIVDHYRAALGRTGLSPDQAAEASAFASSLASGRSYDQETFATLSVLLALAGLAAPRPARRRGLWLE